MMFNNYFMNVVPTKVTYYKLSDFLGNSSLTTTSLLTLCNTQGFATNDATNELTLCTKYLYPKHYDDVIALTYDDEVVDYSKFKRLYITIFNNTAVKYNKLIEQYESLKTKLIDSIERKQTHSGTDTFNKGTTTTTENKLNDTPNVENAASTVFDDSHVSEYNHNKRVDTGYDSTQYGHVITDKVDTDYNIDKLKNLEEKIQDVYVMWANEFRRLFEVDDGKEV